MLLRTGSSFNNQALDTLRHHDALADFGPAIAAAANAQSELVQFSAVLLSAFSVSKVTITIFIAAQRPEIQLCHDTI